MCKFPIITRRTATGTKQDDFFSSFHKEGKPGFIMGKRDINHIRELHLFQEKSTKLKKMGIDPKLCYQCLVHFQQKKSFVVTVLLSKWYPDK